MDADTETFTRHRPRLLGIAYRMLGTRAEAEDVVQDAWLRWREADTDALRSTEAWLVTVVTRLSIDRLRAAKAERENYFGFWLPEPLVDEARETPHGMVELADHASMAFLAVLERLGPDERAAFLMREVFDADYAELARTLGKSEAACRQLVHRAKVRVAEGKPRFVVDPVLHESLLRQFAEAAGRGDFEAMTGLLADDASLVSDGGGIVPSFGKLLEGGRRLAQLYYAFSRREGERLRFVLAQVNGEPGLLRYTGDALESVQTFEIADGRIQRIHVQRNPHKLANVARAMRLQ